MPMTEFMAWLPGSSLTVVEVGVFAGESTEWFLRSGKVARLLAIDTWRGGYDPTDTASNANMTEARAAFLEGPGNDPRVTVLIADSLTAAALLRPRAVDLVYIDADHRYEAVVRDLPAWRPHVRSGGWLAGHDYTVPQHPGVRQAVDEILGKPDRIFADTSWVKAVR
jgi:cephalosporin hydroxylase